MTDATPETVIAAAPVAASEDRLLPGIVYALYLLGFSNGITFIVGVILAHVQESTAGPKMKSHYTFLIRTFWLSVAAFLVAGAVFAISIPLSFVLIGIPGLIVSGLFMGAIAIWFLVRSIVGLVYLARDEAYPRPNTWLV
ncbi:DUF4870 family protein [Caulobacter sp. NIBR2454]|uniref:DUF4870 family protein n=1 Tax=Caulobacter sp. NIBR2454 TaxID=3015996 RepID=UPI0022B6B278|nr:hypothetical protein [Caulobacter sp. NIBR2454]